MKHTNSLTRRSNDVLNNIHGAEKARHLSVVPTLSAEPLPTQRTLRRHNGNFVPFSKGERIAFALTAGLLAVVSVAGVKSLIESITTRPPVDCTLTFRDGESIYGDVEAANKYDTNNQFTISGTVKDIEDELGGTNVKAGEEVKIYSAPLCQALGSAGLQIAYPEIPAKPQN